eukprot:scaffold4143_cov52-Prasinocladus_malaysianus.AAC.1
MPQATGEPDATLIVIEANYLFEPEFEISRIVEHAMVRGQDCATFCSSNDAISMIPRACVAMEGSEQSPKVTAIDGMKQPLAGDTMLGPVTVFRKTSTAELGFMADSGCSASQQLAYVVVQAHEKLYFLWHPSVRQFS